MKTTTRRTEAQQRALLEKMESLRRDGVSDAEIGKRFKVGTQYRAALAHKFRKKKPENKVKTKRIPKSPSLVTFNVPTQSTPLVLLIGMPQDIAHALDRLASIQGAR